MTTPTFDQLLAMQVELEDLRAQLTHAERALEDHSKPLRDDVVRAAAAFVTHHERGQPGTPDTLYPMTYGALDQWHVDWDARYETLRLALERLDETIR